MEKDAISAGVKTVGGLFSTAEIKILVCYIIDAVRDAVPGQMLANVLHYEGIANCFEVNAAIADLCESGQLKVFNEKEDTYVITEKGKMVARELKTTLPFTVKDRAYTAAIKMVSRFKNAKNCDIEIEKDNGKTYAICSLTDNGNTFMSIKLQVTDEEQAMLIKEKFITNPTKIYSDIINILTD